MNNIREIFTQYAPEYVRRFGALSATTSGSAMRPCSKPPPTLLQNFLVIQNTSAATSPVSSACCIPGAEQLQYHPHIHYIVAGGALSRKENKWHCARIDFYLPVRAMSKMFSALLSAIPADVWSIDWNVNCQPVGSSRHSVRYLAPYVFKVAISNRRIIKLENRNSNRWRIISLDVMEFLRRFLQHALPTGFMKVRYYGFLNPASSVPLNKIRTLIELAYGFEITCREPALALDPPPICPHCGGKLIYLYSVLPFMMVPARPG